MSMFHLERDAYSTELKCPGCLATFNVIWDTEYGDVIFGEHNIQCPDCLSKLVMRVDSGVTIDAILKEAKNAITK